ncbi:MAG: SDR family NAD(P)-dependent oxidoreductase [Microthrixaceae bacterium]
MKVNGSVGLVTGGASGLGLGVVRMLVENGGRAAIFDLPSSNGAEIAEKLGDAAQFYPIDITDPVAVERDVAGAVERFGRVDLLMNCAGISSGKRVVGRDGIPHDLDHFRRHVEVNLIGLFDVLRHAAVAMSKNTPDDAGERGLIVNVASIAALEGEEGQASYSASKGGVVSLTLPLAREFARHGIRVMCLCPGIMDTAMLEGADDALRQRLTDLSLFPKRLGTPEDVGQLVKAFMETTFLNGEVVRLDAAVRLGP